MASRLLAILLISLALEMIFSASHYFVEEHTDDVKAVNSFHDVVSMKFFHQCSRDEKCTHITLNSQDRNIQLIIQPVFRPFYPKENIRVWLKVAAEPCSIQYLGIGCFSDYLGPELTEMLSTENNKSSPKFNGHLLDMDNFQSYIGNMICRCVLTAASQGHPTAAMTGYGECWSPPSEPDVSKYVRAIQFNFCVDGQLKEKCTHGFCVGTQYCFYLYQIVQ